MELPIQKRFCESTYTINIHKKGATDMTTSNNTIREKIIMDMQRVLPEIRSLMNLSIEGFAKRVGLTRQTLSNIEKNSKSELIMTAIQYIAICSLVDQKLKEWGSSRDTEELFLKLLELVMPDNARKINQKDWTMSTYNSVLNSFCIDRWYESFKYDENIKLDEYKNHIIMLSFRKSKSLLSVNKMFKHLHTIKKDESNGIKIIYLESSYDGFKELIRLLPPPQKAKKDSDYNKYLEILKKINTEYERKLLDIPSQEKYIEMALKTNGWIMQFQNKFLYKMCYLDKYVICNSTIIRIITNSFKYIKNSPITRLESWYYIYIKTVFVYWNNNGFKLWLPFDVSPEIERRVFWRIIIMEISNIYEIKQLSSIDKILTLRLIYYPIHRNYFGEFGFHLDAYCKKIMKELIDFVDDISYMNKKVLSSNEKKALLKDNFDKYQELSNDKIDDIWEYYTKPIINCYSKKSFLNFERTQGNKEE